MSRARAPQTPPDDEDWPLIGRQRELSELEAAYRDPRRRGAVIIGAAGAGRSRLLRDALAATCAQGAHVESVRATRSAAAVPLGALLELVPDAPRPDDDLALMRACARALADRAAGAPAVLGVDDAHLLDPASSALLLHLATAGTAFVLATVRSGEPCPDAIVSLWKDAAALRLELSDVEEEDARALLEAIVGGPVDRAAAQRAIEACAGQTVYLRELARSAIRSGALRLREGLWTIVSPPLPSNSLSELIGGQLADLEASERELVELLALSEPLAAEEVAALGLTPAALSAEAKGVLGCATDGVRLAHPLVAQVVRTSLPALRLPALRERLIDALQSRRSSSDEATLRLARLRLEAGAVIEDEVSLQAALVANQAGEFELAGDLAARALAGGGGLQAAMVLAQARRLAGRHGDAEAILASAEPLAPGDPAVRDYARERVGLMYWELHRPDEASSFLDRVAGWCEDLPWQDFVAALRATYTGLAEGVGDISAARRAADDERLAREPRRMAAAAHRLSLVLAGEGDRAAHSAFGDLPVVAAGEDAETATLATLVVAALESGQRWAELEQHLMSALQDAARGRVREAAGIAAFGLARLHLLQGRYRDASRWLVEAEVHLSRRDPFNTTAGVRCIAVGIAAASGNFEAATTAHERLETWIADHEPRAAHRPAVARAGAWLDWLRNPAVASRRLLADAEMFADELPGLAPALAYDALRAGDPGAPELLARLADHCRARIVTAFAGHGAARAARDGPALLEVAEEMAEIGARRYAVEAASEAAAVFVAQGREDSARRAAARARDLHVPDQDATLPVIDGLDATAVELTPREQQLVELARQGLSNAQIAERLVISVRTVETHLYRAMHKLGVSDRRDM